MKWIALHHNVDPHTDQEWEDLPHVVLTSDAEWDPSVLDHELDDDEQWFDALSDAPDSLLGNPFNEVGDCRHIYTFFQDVQLLK